MTPEESAQIAIFQWASMNEVRFPELRLLCHYPAGGSRNMLEAVKLKRMGVRKGYPDIFMPVARGGFHGLYIELKADSLRPKTTRGKGGVSDEQAWWLAELRKQGFSTHVCWGFDEARKTIEEYVKMGGSSEGSKKH